MLKMASTSLIKLKKIVLVIHKDTIKQDSGEKNDNLCNTYWHFLLQNQTVSSRINNVINLVVDQMTGDKNFFCWTALNKG